MFQRRYSFTSIFHVMAVIGDSLSSGEFQVPQEDNPEEYYYFDQYEYSWGQVLARENRIKVYNFSKGGMTAKCFNETFAKENDFYNPNYRAQAYLIALGVNDLLNLKLEFGSMEDIDFKNSNNNKDTFVGQYAKIIQDYQAIAPKAKFFLISMPKDCRDSSRDTEMKIKMQALLKELAKVFPNTYVLDLYERMEYTWELNKKYFMFGHLNPMGYVYTADAIDTLIDEIIEANPEDFELVGLPA